MGQLAQQKGTAESVKKFGARMVEDHTKAGDELKQAASQSNITSADRNERERQGDVRHALEIVGSGV